MIFHRILKIGTIWNFNFGPDSKQTYYENLVHADVITLLNSKVSHRIKLIFELLFVIFVVLALSKIVKNKKFCEHLKRF